MHFELNFRNGIQTERLLPPVFPTAEGDLLNLFAFSIHTKDPFLSGTPIKSVGAPLKICQTTQQHYLKTVQTLSKQGEYERHKHLSMLFTDEWMRTVKPLQMN